MTRGTLKALIAAQLNDATFFTDDDLNESVQDGYSEAALLSGCIEKRTSISLTANLVYYDLPTLVSDFYSVVQIFNNQTNQWLIPKSTLWLDQNYQNNWELKTGAPKYFAIINYRYIAVVPHPTTSSGTLELYYKAIAPTLSADGTEINLISVERVLQDYCEADLQLLAQEFAKASKSYGKYLAQLRQSKSRVAGRNLPDKVFALAG